VLNGFKQFIMRGNVIDLAVAVVIGAAFTTVVNAVVNGLINPLIGAVFQADSLDNSLLWTIPGTDATLAFGAVLGAILNFLIVAAVVYFVFVLPINTLRTKAEERLKRGEAAQEDEPEPEPELVLLGQIRDLLAERASMPSTEGKHSQ
jgi:large conductance mechanosensitive channel